MFLYSWKDLLINQSPASKDTENIIRFGFLDHKNYYF